MIVVAGNSDVGVAARRLRAAAPPADAPARCGRCRCAGAPKIKRRILNHWDNLDGTVERGYAGQSLWDWEQLPGDDLAALPRLRARQRLARHQRRGAHQRQRQRAGPHARVPRQGQRAGATCSGLRHRRLSHRALQRADRDRRPRDRRPARSAPCKQWWTHKVDEIYTKIPDFGGFLVKANSEGQPGPQDYRRTHADGANMLADAVAPHGGIVMWRAFVYSDDGRPIASSRRTTSSSRSTASSATTCWSR